MAEMLIAIGKDTEKIMDSLNLLCSICRDSPVELLRKKRLQGLAWPTDSWYSVGANGLLALFVRCVLYASLGAMRRDVVSLTWACTVE